jgi:drug/metabolite transporter (DMT)-like permease
MRHQNLPTYFGTPDSYYLLFVRGIMGFISLSFNFWAMITLSLGEATILGFLAPFFTGMFSMYFLKENWEVLIELISKYIRK